MTPHPEWRGLMVDGGSALPIAGVYFYPGETRDPQRCHYAVSPLNDTDNHWDTIPAGRADVLTRLAATHANTVVLSYFGAGDGGLAPMAVRTGTVAGVFDAVAKTPLRILPAIEEGTVFTFDNDFPYNLNNDLAPMLIGRIEALLTEATGHMDKWAQMYDRKGAPRYAINLLHVRSNRLKQVLGRSDDDAAFAAAFQAIADVIQKRDHVAIGFTLDVVPAGTDSYGLSPGESGSSLEQTDAVLGIQSFNSAVWRETSTSCATPKCGAPTTCAGVDNDDPALFAKLVQGVADQRLWVATKVPVIGNVTNAFDGRMMWGDAKHAGAAFWGDAAWSQTRPSPTANVVVGDRWRNAMSLQKGGGIVGVTFDTWNGFTEGYAATPTVEWGSTATRWLTDFFSADPRLCDHVQYVQGYGSAHVYGAICDRWGQLGGYAGFLGAPHSSEQDSQGKHGRRVDFDGGSIYWSSDSGAHDVHGLIAQAYTGVYWDTSCLGLPNGDETAVLGGSVQSFQGGSIRWTAGATQAVWTCTAK